MHKYSSFETEVFSSQIIQKNGMIGSKFRIEKIVSIMQKYNLHFGFDIQSKKQIIIASCLAKKKKKSFRETTNQLPFFSMPTWTGIQSNKIGKFQFLVFQRKGCSIQQYLNNLRKLAPNNLHFLLRQLICLLEKMYSKNFNFKNMNFCSFFIRSDEKNGQQCSLQVLNLGMLIQNSQEVEKRLQYKIFSKLITYPEKSKKVSFNINYQDRKYSLKKDLEVIARKFNELVKKIILNPFRKDKNELSSIQILLNYITQYCRRHYEEHFYKIQTLKNFLKLQSTLINKEQLKRVQAEAIELSKRIINSSKKRIQKSFNTFTQDGERDSEYNEDEIENQCNQKISEDIQSHSFKLKQNWIMRVEQAQLTQNQYSFNKEYQNNINNSMPNSSLFQQQLEQYEIHQRYSHPVRRA